MIEFPNITPPNSFCEDFEDPSIRSKTEDGTVVSRPRFTKSRGTFKQGWTALKNTDYEMLIDFFKNTVKGGSMMFNWAHPKSKKVYLVRLVRKDEFQLTQYGWSGNITLEEV